MRQVGKRGPVSGYSHSSCQASIKSYAAAVYGFLSSLVVIHHRLRCSLFNQCHLCVFITKSIFYNTKMCIIYGYMSERTNQPTVSIRTRRTLSHDHDHSLQSELKQKQKQRTLHFLLQTHIQPTTNRSKEAAEKK